MRDDGMNRHSLASQLGLSHNLARETVTALAVARVLEVRRGDAPTSPARTRAAAPLHVADTQQ